MAVISTHSARRLALILAFCSCLALTARLLTTLPTMEEAGYPDSYILFDARHFAAAGELYGDLGSKPFNAVVYSPMVYAVFSLAPEVDLAGNPFLGARLIVLGAFVGCLLVAGALTRMAVASPAAMATGVLLATTVAALHPWVLRLRGDIFGMLCSLLCVWALAQSRRAHLGLPVVAGLAAGFALLFKLTFVAAPFAGAVWLILQRRWSALGAFAAATVGMGLGGYVAWWVAEPRLFEHILALRQVGIDVREWIPLLVRAAAEPVTLLALPAIPMVRAEIKRPLGLFVILAGTSWAVGAATSLQAGANINYFFEALFAAVPLAAMGLQRVIDRLGDSRWHQAVAAAAAFSLVMAGTLDARAALRSEVLQGSLAHENERMRDLDRALDNFRIFSTVPRITIMSPDPVITEPYLVSSLTRRNAYDIGKLTAPLYAQAYDLVVTERIGTSYRGVPFITPELRQAIAASYMPACTLKGRLFHVPRAGRTTALDSLRAIGCADCGDGKRCSVW